MTEIKVQNGYRRKRLDKKYVPYKTGTNRFIAKTGKFVCLWYKFHFNKN